MSDFNPYTAPEDLGRRPESSDLPWQIDGKILRFRDGAHLPEIDLYSGRDDLPVTPASAEFQVGTAANMLLMRWGGLLIMVPLIIYMVRGQGDFPWLVFIVVLFGWSMVSRFVAARTFSKARLHWHVDGERDQKARRKILWASRVYWIAFVVWMYALLGDHDTWSPWALGLFFVSLILMNIVGRQALQLRCTRMRDGWFEVVGIPGHALSALGARQREVADEWDEESGPIVVRKVCTAYIYRFSLRALLHGVRFRPMVVVMVIIMKLTRAKSLVREGFDPSESEALDSKGWDPLLREHWEGITQSGADHGWQLLEARYLDSPRGDLLSQWFVITSPDQQTSATIALTRVTNARAASTVSEAVFRSWTSEGSQLVTSNVPFQKPLAAGSELRFVNGEIDAVRRAHDERLSGRSLVAFESAAAWITKLKEESARRHQALVAGGFYSPSREVKLRRRGGGWVPVDDEIPARSS